MNTSLQQKLIALCVTIIAFATVYTLFFDDEEHWNGMDDNIDENTANPFMRKFMNRLYFTMTTTSTVGYGDISPASTSARTVVMLNMVIVTIEGMAILRDLILSK